MIYGSWNLKTNTWHPQHWNSRYDSILKGTTNITVTNKQRSEYSLILPNKFITNFPVPIYYQTKMLHVIIGPTRQKHKTYNN